MPTAKKQVKGAQPTAEERTPRQVARALQKQANSKKYRAGREDIKNASKEVLAATIAKKADAVRAKKPHPEELNEEQLEKIVELVALGVPIHDIARDNDDLPSEYHFWKFIADTHSSLAKAYARGKKLAIARLEEEIERIAATPMRGVLKTRKQTLNREGDIEDLEEVREYEMTEHRRMLIDTHKWTLAHLTPRKHGRQLADPDEGASSLKSLIEQFRARNAQIEQDAGTT